MCQLCPRTGSKPSPAQNKAAAMCNLFLISCLTIGVHSKEINREFWNFGLFSEILAPNQRANSVSYNKIPYATEQGIKSSKQGISFEKQGIL
jgi:hypothetical protein